MTYIEAANKADQAKARARSAYTSAKDPVHEDLAQAIASLAEAVGELARALHRSN